MKQILISALEKVEKGEKPILVTIASSKGSTPRKAGATMLADENGIICGTVGGGELEYKCLQLACVTQGLRHFELDNGKAAQVGMICGGSAEVLFTPLVDIETLRKAVRLADNRFGGIILSLDGKSFAAEVFEEIPSVKVSDRGLILPVTEREQVVIFGGGHVSLALSELLDLLEIKYIVADEREEFCNKERFPNAVKLYNGDFTLIGNDADIDKDTAICIMTRGHQGDTQALRFALRSNAGYIGLMGSRRKREITFAALEAEGFENVRERVVTPIGLDISAQTPMEIAVSIAGELIKWKRESV